MKRFTPTAFTSFAFRGLPKKSHLSTASRFRFHNLEMAPSLAQDIQASGGPSYSIERFDPFHTLVSDLSRKLGPSSGLTSDDVDVQELFKLMEDYTSVDDQWIQYAFGDSSRGYTRNLVDEGNGKSNLLVLVWTPGKGSPVHDHVRAHCLMKVLKGTLRETLFATPEDGTNDASALRIIRETTYTRNQVTYMADELGLHRIENPSSSEAAVSLHLYTPPNAAKEGCNIFDEKTGRKSHATQCHFYSKFGYKGAD